MLSKRGEKMNETKQYIIKWKHASKIGCKECGYYGSMDTTRSFDGLGEHGVVRYVCPKCLNCGTYFDELDEFISPNQNFCSDKCMEEFIEDLDKEKIEWAKYDK